MITVTERAANALQELLATNSALPGQGVKLVPSGVNSIGMVIEAPNEGDEVILHEGEPLLIVDSRIASDLDGAELDYETGEADDPPLWRCCTAGARGARAEACVGIALPTGSCQNTGRETRVFYLVSPPAASRGGGLEG